MNIVITGASRGIGAALAREFSGGGHRVLLISRNRPVLQEVADACNRQSGSVLAHAIPFDLVDLPDLEADLLSHMREYATSVDAMVNNAGQLIRKPFMETDTGDARRMFEANFFAPAQLIKTILPMMAGSDLKHVVNVTSMGGFQGSSKFSGLSYYSASKAALGALTECLAEELKGEGVKMNALALGSVQTEMLAEAFPGYTAPLDPSRMARFMAWFTLEGANYFNGKVIPVSLSTP